MKKILIIACGLMFSSLSAMTLPDHVQVVKYEKMSYQEPVQLFADQVLLIDECFNLDFVLKFENTSQLHEFAYVRDIDVVKKKGFLKPILYENFNETIPFANYDIYKHKDPFWNEVLFSNRIRDFSKTLVV